MRYNPQGDGPVKPPPVPQSSEAKLFKRLFWAELALAVFLYISYGPINDLEAGGIIFILPLLAVYSFMLGAIYALPVMAFSIFKKKQAGTAGNIILISLGGITNSVAAIVLSIEIVRTVVLGRW